MDLEDIAIQLEQVRQSQDEMKALLTSMQNSSAASESERLMKRLVFEQLRKLEEQNSERLKESVKELGRSAERTSQEVSGAMARTSKSVIDTVSAGIKNAEGGLRETAKDFYKTVADGKKAIAESVDKERKAHFKILANCLTYIAVGGVVCGLSIFAFNFFKIRGDYYRRLVEENKLEQIQKKAVDDYKKGLIKDFQGGVEIYSLVKDWDARHPEYWQNPEERNETNERRIENLKNWAKRETAEAQ